jgi:putative FmdB family regulatory protein
MPIYEYECKDCRHQFEAIHKISEGPPSQCPACGHTSLQKLVSKVAFRLKGTGWYETDFKNKGGDKKTDTAGAADESSAKGDSDKGDKDNKDNKDKKESADPKDGKTAKETTAIKESATKQSKVAGGGESKKAVAKSDD